MLEIAASEIAAPHFTAFGHSGETALMMDAAGDAHLSVLRLLLAHSANPDLQSNNGRTALMIAASQGREAYVKALLRANASTELQCSLQWTALQWAESNGQTAIAELLRQHAAPPQLAAPPDASEATRSSLASLPEEILAAAGRGELQKVVKWLHKGGKVDALGSFAAMAPMAPNHATSPISLLHAAVTYGQLEMVKELLKRGASVDLQTALGASALMGAVGNGHLSIVHVLLQHSANPDLKNSYGATALMWAAYGGQEACVQALLRAKADTELLNEAGFTALQLAEARGHTAIATLIQHAACLSLGPGVAYCAVSPHSWPWVVLSLVLGAIASVAFSRNLTAVSGQHRTAQQKRPRRPGARYFKANGRTTTAGPIRQHAESPQPAAASAPHVAQAEQAARADLAEEPPLERTKKQNTAGRAAAATADEPSGVPPAASLNSLPATAPRPAVSAAEREAGGSAQVVQAPLWRLQVEEDEDEDEDEAGGSAQVVKAPLRRLQIEEDEDEDEEAERKAKQESAAEAVRLAAAEQAREAAAQVAARAAQEACVAAQVAAQEAARAAARVAAASKAREVAVTAAAAAAAAEAEANALERAATDGGEGGSSGAAGPPEASEVAVPDEYMCSITSEIMTDPVTTVRSSPPPDNPAALCPAHSPSLTLAVPNAIQADGFTYERSAIEQWLKTHNTSPTTGVELESKQLIQCHSLRSLIRDFYERSRRRALTSPKP